MNAVTFCPKCGNDSGVFETRTRSDGTIHRRRKCVSCGDRWSTVEINADMMRRVERYEKAIVGLTKFAAEVCIDA